MTCNEGVEIVCFGIRAKEVNSRLRLTKGICCEVSGVEERRERERGGEGERERGRNYLIQES